MRLQRLDHVAVVVADVERAAAWYTEVLGLTQVHGDVWGFHPAMLVSRGMTGVALFPTGSVLPHIAFGTDAEGFQEAQTELRKRGIEFTYDDHGPTESIYFDSPFGQRLEITHDK